MGQRTYARPLCLGLSLAIVLSLAGCANREEGTVMDPTVTVETAAAQNGSLSSDTTYIGTISAEGTAQVVTLVSGNVEEVGVSVGDTVSAGDFLCRIDDESARLSLQNAQATYQSALAGMATAQAAVASAEESYQSALAQYGGTDGSDSLPVIEEQVRLAENNYEDTLALFDIGAASQIEVDQAYQTMISAQAGLKSAQAGLASAQAGVQQAQSSIESAQAGAQQAQVAIGSAEYQLTLYNLTSPISGVVEAVNVTKNNFTSSGTAAFIISNGRDKTVTFYVTDAVRSSLRLGQEVTVTYGGQTYGGAVTEIGGVVDAYTGQFKVKAIIDGAGDLPDGLTVELTTAAHTVDRAALIPADALYFEDGVAYVYLAQDGTAVRREVTVGLYTTETIAVTDGLNEGDAVITSWSSSLRDGVPIRQNGETEDGEAEAQ